MPFLRHCEAVAIATTKQSTKTKHKKWITKEAAASPCFATPCKQGSMTIKHR
ncbi:hypothetical protein [Helicobacter canis]|uniref:hypothetical protein n=1 Tax=Helicobacter canis TaxID=29419 RepID=UPI001B881D4F|nr:hypothetical protein [Helicobacter canis]